MASIELDPPIKLALAHLHSSSRGSTEQLRLIFDELLAHTYDSSKTMANVLPKKYIQEERNIEGSSYQKRHKSESSSKSGPGKAVSSSPPPIPPQLQIAERDSEDVMESFNLLEEDLTCAVCRQFAVQAGNRLVECDACHDLYHQDCHKPVISESDMESGWQCANCLITTHGFSMTSVASTKSSSSSIKNSPSKQVTAASTAVKITSSSSSSSKLVTPNINIISADKRLQNMKKKAAKQQENKRKHSK